MSSSVLERVKKIRKPKIPVPLEKEVQAEIEAALELAGFVVMHTTAFRQKGPSGVSKGLPDLLCIHPECPKAYLGIEVKRPGAIKYTSPEQEFCHRRGDFYVAQCPEDALRGAVAWLIRYLVKAEDPVTEMLVRSEAGQRSLDKAKRALKAFQGGS